MAQNNGNGRLKRYFPPLTWGAEYSASVLSNDLFAALIVTIMLVPQSLAYALLAGLPPEVGLYASIAPLLAYALFGSSRTLAVGPVAVISLMTAAAIGEVAPQGTVEYVTAASFLALLSGAMLLVLGLLRFGFIANFLSHPVISGFITASGILISASQLKHFLGIGGSGSNLVEIFASLVPEIGKFNLPTFVVAVGSTAFLFGIRRYLKSYLSHLGIRPRLADLAAKAGPIIAVFATAIIAWAFDLESYGVRLVGTVPQGLPHVSFPATSFDLLNALIGPALLLSVIGFVESVSVAQTLAAKRRQRIDPDQELIGLGVSNIGAGLTGGFPVTGGFARSVVNFDAGAETPAAGAFTAVGIALATLFLTPLLQWLPQATLAATIVIAVLSLVDFSVVSRAWAFSRSDFVAVAATITITLIFGVEYGIMAGVMLSLMIHLYKTSRPHIAVVGQVPGTEHFRNVLRHPVRTDGTILSVRVDESLYFANAHYLEDQIYEMIVQKPDLKHVILMCPAVNNIDLSALESLHAICERLASIGVNLHLSEVKGPVMDRIRNTDFIRNLTGRIFLSQHQAVQELGSGQAQDQSWYHI